MEEQNPQAVTAPRLTPAALLDLRRGVAGVPPLPAVLAFQRDRVAARDLILRRKAEGRSWAAIANELNALGLRPQKVAVFTPTQVSALYHGWRRKVRDAASVPPASPAQDVA